MAAALDSQRLGAIFQSRPDIIEGIKRAADSPGRIALFNEITGHIYDQLHDSGEPAQKRRRVDAAQANGAAAPSGPGDAADETVLLEVKEISVSAPQRKKFELCLTQNFLYARAPGTVAPVSGITYAWRDIEEYIFYLPVPDKAQVQHNYVLFPRGTSLPSKTNPPTAEPLVFTAPSTAPKEGTIGGGLAGPAAAVSDTYRSLFHWAFDKRLKAAGNTVELISADPSKFHSVIRQAHRPNEKAVHVGGFRGSKDGYLFFLEKGILWGFKKPLIFIPLSRIAAISYTSILQITFNIVVEVFSGEGEDTDELEFGMLDQQDYGGIDNYIKLNRLQDRSMAEQRKGKLQLAENRGPKKNAADGQDSDAGEAGAQAGSGMGELQRAELEAEQQMQDDEDEDEEDYDPGSEGDSEGSGDSSDEEDDGDEDGDGEDDEDEDDEGEGEGGNAEDEEVEEEEEEEKPPPVKKGARTVPQVPVRQGWATIGNRRPADDLDMDE
ncbi:Histone chaperone [Tolypocladium ophioglossoides CBS 100239]|uniref:Histone chaperone n=1 Tax=Tolypocladium ophioglossoides (strain CBS 100239) TaxID=1163406 RepID=A0A0L0MYL7_TOLOC|nr:Histone chaperone [Tolypocladium ophioglossoides CBS 100239]